MNAGRSAAEDCETAISPVDCANVAAINDRRETWITGIGLVSSLGDGLEANWDALRGGRVNIDLEKYAPWMIHPLAPLNLDNQIPKKGRPAPDGSMAAHRHLRSRTRAGFRRHQARQRLCSTIPKCQSSCSI